MKGHASTNSENLQGHRSDERFAAECRAEKERGERFAAGCRAEKERGERFAAECRAEKERGERFATLVGIPPGRGERFAARWADPPKGGERFAVLVGIPQRGGEPFIARWGNPPKRGEAFSALFEIPKSAEKRSPRFLKSPFGRLRGQDLHFLGTNKRLPEIARGLPPRISKCRKIPIRKTRGSAPAPWIGNRGLGLQAGGVGDVAKVQARVDELDDGPGAHRFDVVRQEMPEGGRP